VEEKNPAQQTFLYNVLSTFMTAKVSLKELGLCSNLWVTIHHAFVPNCEMSIED
jgi:hypothetical protein